MPRELGKARTVIVSDEDSRFGRQGGWVVDSHSWQGGQGERIQSECALCAFAACDLVSAPGVRGSICVLVNENTGLGRKLHGFSSCSRLTKLDDFGQIT